MSGQRRRNSRKHLRARGFTLLEIMLVVGLLALLAAFVVPSLITRSKEAKISITKAAIDGTMSDQIRQFQMDCDKFPETLMDLCTKPSDEETAKKWKGPYIESADKMKDAWQHEFNYKGGDASVHNEKKFDLWSNGPDGIEGTEDDIVNWKKDT